MSRSKPDVCMIPPMSEAAYQEQMANAQSGVDPLGRGREAPGPTRTTNCPWTETASRKPYAPVTNTSTPSLEDGVSFRQKLDCYDGRK